jgi:uncharacterized protein
MTSTSTMITWTTDNWYNGQLSWLKERTVFLTKHGSHCYGTNTASSDLDIKGLCIPPKKYFLGFLNKFEQAEGKEPFDLVVYNISKFFKLAADCNPNIIEVLFTDEADHLITSPVSDILIQHRDLFLSRKAKHTFSGYAASQLKRIRTHRRWLTDDRPAHQPTRAEFGLPDHTLIPRPQLIAAEAIVNKKLDEWHGWDFSGVDSATIILIKSQISNVLKEMHIASEDLWKLAARTTGLTEDTIQVMEQERRYQTKKREWTQYQEWLKTRNPDRAAIEKRFGFDCKHGAHLVRLLKMCREILETGKVIVKRPDSEELLYIRNGGWSYDRLVEWAEAEDLALNQVMRQSKLPHSPDRKFLDRLLVEIVESYNNKECNDG